MATSSTPSDPHYCSERITRSGPLPLMTRLVMGHTDSIRLQSFMEVFSVCIDKFGDTERRGEIYGSIEVIDIFGPLKLYDRDRKNPEHISANRTICLTGPSRPMLSSLGFAVNIELHLINDRDGSDLADIQVSKWQLSWDEFKPEVAYIARGKFLSDFADQPDVLCSDKLCTTQPAGSDQLLSAVFENHNGCCLTMQYAILLYAVRAYVEVEIVHVGLDVTPTDYDVRGSIFALYGYLENDPDLNMKDCKITLLKTSELGSVKARRWKKMQLSRWVIAVPAYTSLIMEADLWYGPHLQIAKGKLEFTPDCSFTVDYIAGENDLAIRVLVGWSHERDVPSGTPFSY